MRCSCVHQVYQVIFTESAHDDNCLQGHGLGLMKDYVLLTNGMIPLKIMIICGRYDYTTFFVVSYFLVGRALDIRDLKI